MKLDHIGQGSAPVRSTRDPSTLELSSPRPRTRGARIERVSQSAPLRFAVAVLAGWFLAAGLAVGLWSAITGDPLLADASQTAGRVVSTVLLLGILHRPGWLKPSGIVSIGSRRVWLIAGVAVVYLVPAYVWGLFGMSGLEALPSSGDAVLRELPAGVSVGIAEEVLFRGVLLFVLVRVWGADRTGVLRAVLVTSVLFGLLHALPALAGEDIGYVAANLMHTIVSAVWWAALVLAYRTIWPGIVIHALTNSVALAVAAVVPGASLGSVGPLRIVLVEMPFLIFGLWLLMDERRFPRRSEVPVQGSA